MLIDTVAMTIYLGAQGLIMVDIRTLKLRSALALMFESTGESIGVRRVNRVSN